MHSLVTKSESRLINSVKTKLIIITYMCTVFTQYSLYAHDTPLLGFIGITKFQSLCYLVAGHTTHSIN